MRMVGGTSRSRRGSGTMGDMGSPTSRLPRAKDIKRAEMYAILQVLIRAFPPLIIYTDHKAIPDGLRKGKV